MIDNKLIFCAPLQGYTDCVWRNAHAAIFGGVDHYCTPFARIERGEIKKRDLIEIAPMSNHVQSLIPQILAGKIDETLTLALKIVEAGYKIIDLNMGCPHPPIALKHKGSGLLKFPDEIAVLARELKTIPNVTFTIKMRLGWDDVTQWKQVVKSIAELNPLHITLHPRLGKQQYKGDLIIEEFRHFYNSVDYPIIYNGGINTLDDIINLFDEFHKLKGVMVGRGLLSHPHLFSNKNTTGDYKQFHDMLYKEYSKRLTGGDTQILNKMKSLWEYFLPETDHKLIKAIKKSHNLQQYLSATNLIFSQ